MRVRTAHVESGRWGGSACWSGAVSNTRSVSLEQAAVEGPVRPVSDFRSPDRILTCILAARERAPLNWLCRRMPSWVTPDRLTAAGTIGATIAGLGYVASNRRPEFLFLA